MYAATKNTFAAKESLKSCGAKWNSEKKVWDCSEFDKEKWETKMINPTWNGRGCAKSCAMVIFENV